MERMHAVVQTHYRSHEEAVLDVSCIENIIRLGNRVMSLQNACMGV